MSRTGVIVALMIAAVLAVAAAWVVRSSGPRAPAGPLLNGLDVGAVTSIEIDHPDGRRTRIAPDERAAGTWIMHFPDGAGVERSWPAAGARVRAALRLLADLRVDAAAGGGGGGGTRVTLGTGRDGPRVLVLSEASVAGKTRVRLDGGAAGALADSALLDIFRPESLAGWRDPSVFGGDVSDASRLTLSAPGRDIAIARVGRSWGLTMPRAGPADEPMVSTVLNTLSGCAIKAFVERATPESEGAFGGGVSRVVVETDRRLAGAAGDERWTVIRSVTLGGPADVGGASVFARLEAWIEHPGSAGRTQLWGPMVAVVDHDALNGVPVDAAAYASRIAVRAAMADVGALRVTPMAVAGGDSWDGVRGATGWTIEERAASSRTGAVLDALLKLLTQERATAVKAEAPVGFVQVARIAVVGADNAIAEECSLLVPEPGQKPALCVEDDSMWRVYSGPGVPVLVDWLRAGATGSP